MTGYLYIVPLVLLASQYLGPTAGNAEKRGLAPCPRGRDVLSTCQHLRQDGVLRVASVASASTSEGHPRPAPIRNAESPKSVEPVLAFPDPELDDTAAYQGYQTRFYRDSRNNTVQVYLQPQTSRAVLVWADAANESAGFNARDSRGRPTRLFWGATAAEVADSGPTRSIEFRLTTPLSAVQLGWFVLGSMRVERDFVYAKAYEKPFGGPYRVAEESLLVADVARLPVEEQREHLQLLHAGGLEQLRSRLVPSFELKPGDSVETIRIERPSLDGRNFLRIELRVDPRRVKARIKGQTVSLETRPGSALRFGVRVTTDAAPLNPLSRQEIFNKEFLDFLARDSAGSDSAAIAARRLERQVRGVELLSSREKLMAGLPNFATYFGRDMMMTALMMRPIWSPDMPEHVIASVLRKLGPRGDVSHEEALGGQAIREHAVVYDSLLNHYLKPGAGGRTRADSALGQAREVLADLQRTRENYHMIDDEFQLPVLAAHYLADSLVPANRKRAFLQEKSESGESRLALLLRELNLVSSLSLPYVERPRAKNLVSFPKRDATHWRSASWRDSDAGYAGGRFAMDINAIWVPQALEAIGVILHSLKELGLGQDSSTSGDSAAALHRYNTDSTFLRRAIDTWKGARKHFTVKLSAAQIRNAVNAKLRSLRSTERAYWNGVLTAQKAPTDSLTFLALSLDTSGKPIGVVNTDVATDLFLNRDLAARAAVRELEPVLRPYPVGLFVDSLGPLVANDAFAPPAIWQRFENDRYHSPRVVWGREVNLLFLGLANQVISASELEAHTGLPIDIDGKRELQEALQGLLGAVNQSGLQHNELWSYEIKGRKLKPMRYGTSSDVQLWNTTNLVVQYVLSRLPH
jgi:hypothetical protein